jgi:D-glycero-D-manno-heptose 1,7-bisphosphate phosphatase
MTRRFILLDRDGTLNVERNYLADPEQLQLLPGVSEALSRLRPADYGLIVLSNQSGIGRGYFSRATVDLIHDRLRAMLADKGVILDGIYLCPHHPDEPCQCRKPRTGLVEQAVADWRFDPSRSFMVGDKDADIQLGRAVGASTVLVRTGWGKDTEAGGNSNPDFISDDLAGAIDWILQEGTER